MSARIYHFPKPWRRRHATPVVPVFFVNRPRSWIRSGGFALLLGLTLPAAFFYLSGAISVARHDRLYAVLLAAVWCLYFLYPLLLRVRVLGPILIWAGRLLLLAGVGSFFGFVLWLVLSHP